MEEKRMFAVTVHVDDGAVMIEQPGASERDDDLIALHPDQIDPLIKWLGEARDEIATKGALDE